MASTANFTHMLSHNKKAKPDAAANAWLKAQALLAPYMPDMITVNHGIPFTSITSTMNSVELCFNRQGEAIELAIEVANLLSKPVYEIQQKLLYDGGSCEYFQLNLNDAIQFFGESFCSILLRITLCINNTSNITLNDVMKESLIKDITSLDNTASNLLASMEHTTRGSHPLVFLAQENSDAAFYFLDKLEEDTCENIALQETAQGFYFNLLHVQIPDDESRFCFFDKIRQEIFQLIAHDSRTIALFTSFNMRRLNATLQSLDEDLIEVFMFSQLRAGLFFAYEDRNGFAEHSTLAEALFFQSDCRSVSMHNLRYLNECLRGRLSKKFLATLGLKEIEFARMGNAIDNWWRLTSAVVALAPIPKKRASIVDELTAGLSLDDIMKPSTIPTLTENAKLETVLGRTLLFRQTSQAIRAIKVKKREESAISLTRESCVTKSMLTLKTKYQLLSRFPTPQGVMLLHDLIPWTEQSAAAQTPFLSRIDAASTHPAYVYDVKKADVGYFTYLHDPKLTNQEFKQANRVIVHDLFKLLQQGQVFNQLADLFHDSERKSKRPDSGRYIVLAQMLKHTRGNFGTGMLESWLEAIEFPNVRATGLADLGDCISINDYIELAPHIVKCYARTVDHFDKKSGNYLIANIMAEYQYVLFLIAGRRAVGLEKAAVQRGESEENTYLIWYNAAKQVIFNCAQAISINSFLSEREARRQLTKVVDVNRLAAQMQFWMTNRYIDYLSQGVIPPDIYGEDVEVRLDVTKFKSGNFDQVLGFTSNGKTTDLGDYNGQEPIKEGNKLFYWMVNIMFVEYANVNGLLKDVNTVTRAVRQQNTGNAKVTLSQHLGGSDKYALLFSLWKLHKNAQRVALQEKLERDDPQAKLTQTAITLQRIWRGRNKRAKVGLLHPNTPNCTL